MRLGGLSVKKQLLLWHKVCIMLAFALLFLGAFAFSLLLRTYPSFEHRRASAMMLFTYNAPLCLWTEGYLAFCLFADTKRSKTGIFRKIFFSPWVLIPLLSILTTVIIYYVFMGNIDAKIQQDKNYQMVAEQLSAVEELPTSDAMGYATLMEPLSWEYFSDCYACSVRITFQHCRFPFLVKKYVQQLCKDYGRENWSETITTSSELQRLEWNDNDFYHTIILWKDCKLLAFRIYGSQEGINNILSHLELDSYVF